MGRSDGGRCSERAARYEAPVLGSPGSPSQAHAYFLQASFIWRLKSASVELVCAAFFALLVLVSQRANTLPTCVSEATWRRYAAHFAGWAALDDACNAERDMAKSWSPLIKSSRQAADAATVEH